MQSTYSFWVHPRATFRARITPGISQMQNLSRNREDFFMLESLGLSFQLRLLGLVLFHITNHKRIKRVMLEFDVGLVERPKSD